MAAALAAVLAAALVAGGGASARAAGLSVRAPEACADADDVREQVDGLLGRPLAGVEGVDFEVEIAPASEGPAFRLRLDTVYSDGKRTRELTGKTCQELAEAAAVAIAMTIQNPPSPPPPSRRPSPPASAPPPPSSPPPALATAAPPPPAPWRPRPTVGLGMIVDAGALPSVGPGVAVEAAADLPIRPLRLLASGALLAPRETRVAEVGGSFQLAFGALLACAPRALGAVTALACVGGELGRLSGEGVGVARSRLGSALWSAARVDVGASIPFGGRLALVARGGVAAPLARPVFLVDGATRVFRPSSLAARLTVGLEVGF